MNDRAKFDNSDLESLVPAVTFSRRGFMASGLATGFALAAGPVVAQTMIVTPTDGLEVQDVKIPVADGSMPAYVAMPKKAGRFPVVIVIPEIWGMHEHIKDVTRRLAKAGYFAITPEPYFRQGDLTKMTNIQDVLKGANALADTVMLSDLDSLVTWVEGQKRANARRIGITGFCRGGRTVWMYIAHSKKIRAGVAWYGGLSPVPGTQPQTPIDVAGQLNAPVLGLYGGADQGIPLELVERLRAALFAFGKEKESIIHVYDGMPHAFNADYRPSYRKEAAEDGWKRMLAWFKKHGV